MAVAPKSAKDMRKEELIEELINLAHHQRDDLKEQLRMWRSHSEIEIAKLEKQIRLLDEYIDLHKE